ncbi:hypothetical protein J1614_000148 [Plenodomus biglobosus]|nr:hypothetical protein J1614_000148 [Plenodomus biglobosus]
MARDGMASGEMKLSVLVTHGMVFRPVLLVCCPGLLRRTGGARLALSPAVTGCRPSMATGNWQLATGNW